MPSAFNSFSLGDEKGFEWIGAYDITADELLAGTDTAKTESKTAQAQMLILEDVYKRQVLYALKDFLIKRLGSLLEHTT